MMAVAIPHAFGDDALLFVACYLIIQLGRHTFLTFAAADRGTNERERAGRILTWFVFAGVFWVAGALAGGGTRTLLWLVALLIDYAGPLAVFWVPGRRHLHGDAWQVETGHFSERFGLFVIIALGESIVITGATTSELRLDTVTAAAFATAFLITAGLWWLYFSTVARIVERELEQSPDRTTLARDAYTYLHVVLVAGVVVAAVGDELVIAHPREPLSTAELMAVVGGPALYLLAHALFRLRIARTLSPRRLTGALACVLIGVLASEADALVVSALVLAVLGVLIALDQWVAGRRRHVAAHLQDVKDVGAA
jgi:low temperature requirement protein LtrA